MLTFNITSESYLMGDTFSSIPSMTATLFDGNHQIGWTNTSSNCYFGMSFRQGYVGVVNEVNYFMNRFNKTKYIGNLKF